MIKTNSLKAWWLACRPKTLTGAAAPVIIALVAAYHVYGTIDWAAALLCLFFALLMQTDANLINDYFDCIHDVDNEERLGPERACTQGWITLRAMRWGICVTTLLACLTGLPLIAWGGWECIIIGIACVVFCFLYTTLFSRIALGDVLVVMFFGLIPVAYTFYFQSSHTSIADLPQGIWLLALAQGLITDCLLLVNNFRDRDTDAKAGKTTLVTIIGPQLTLWLYSSIGILSALLAYGGITSLSQTHRVCSLLPILFIPIHMRILKQMRIIYHGRELNKVLGMTALSIFLFSIICSLTLILV